MVLVEELSTENDVLVDGICDEILFVATAEVITVNKGDGGGCQVDVLIRTDQFELAVLDHAIPGVLLVDDGDGETNGWRALDVIRVVLAGELGTEFVALGLTVQFDAELGAVQT